MALVYIIENERGARGIRKGQSGKKEATGNENQKNVKCIKIANICQRELLSQSRTGDSHDSEYQNRFYDATT